MTHAKLVKAHRMGKGARIHLTHEELQGAGLLDVIKKGVQFVSKHAGVLKPLATAVLDTGAHFIGPAATPYREGIRSLTGVGVKPRAKKPKRKTAKRAVGGSLIPAGYSGF